MMRRCLFLAHRFPYPPNKGEKIRAWNIIRTLSKSFRVDVAAFIDDAADLDTTSELGKWAENFYFADISKNSLISSGVRSLLRNLPITLGKFGDAKVEEWVGARNCDDYDLVILSSSSGALLLDRLSSKPKKLLVDLVDVDSEKWKQLAGQSIPPMSWIFRREARLMKSLEQNLVSRADGVLLATKNEEQLLRKQSTHLHHSKISTLLNAVDVDWWSHGKDLPSPYDRDATTIIFTGRMDYRPNVEGTVSFTHRVLPLIGKQIPNVSFVIAGAAPTRAVRNLARIDGVVVTGRVKDMRPWLAHATIAVAPITFGRGLQSKILDAMACSTPIVATSTLTKGIEAEPGRHWLIEDDPQKMANAICKLITCKKKHKEQANSALSFVKENYDISVFRKALLAHIDAL